MQLNRESSLQTASAPTVLFRVDESIQVGRGHMARCKALAQNLRDRGATVHFYCQQIRPKTVALLHRENVNVTLIKLESEFLANITPGVSVVIDGYHLNPELQEECRKLGAKVFFIDDIRPASYQCDVLVCYNEGAEQHTFNTAQHTRVLAGGKYLQVSREFRQEVIQSSNRGKRRHILICSGGTRPTSLVRDLLALVTTLWPRDRVVLLSAHPIRQSVVRPKKQRGASQIKFETDVTQTRMIEIFRKSKLAIIPASTMLLEAFSAGCPIITGWIAANQKYSPKFYAHKRLVVQVGDLHKLNVECLKRAAGRLSSSRNTSERQKSYIKASLEGTDALLQEFIRDNC